MRTVFRALFMTVLVAALAACDLGTLPGANPDPSPSESESPSDAPSGEPTDEPPSSEEPPAEPGREGTLRAAAEAAGIDFGTAVAADPLANETDYSEAIAAEFSSVTAENVMKPDALQPQRGQFDFAAADALVDFAQANDQVVRGHTLVWHSQNPNWLINGSFSNEELRQILQDHITEVVSHFQGDVVHWDVANEVIDDSANLRESVWSPLGESYIADAFRWADEADPGAKLYLNDYSIEGINAKSDAYYELVQRLLADGVPIDGIGFQTHLISGQFPSTMQENIQRFADLGLEVAITEADVRIELPVTDEKLQTQADTFRSTVEACLAVPECVSYTAWGFTDRHSWVPGVFDGQGAATLMNEDLEPKPAYDAVLEALHAGG